MIVRECWQMQVIEQAHGPPRCVNGCTSPERDALLLQFAVPLTNPQGNHHGASWTTLTLQASHRHRRLMTRSLSPPSLQKWQRERRLHPERRRPRSLLRLHHHRRDPSDLPLHLTKSPWPTIPMLPYVELTQDAFKSDLERMLMEN